MSSTPQFGEPVAELPMPARSIFERYWTEVGKYVRERPDTWHPLIDPPITISRLGALGTLMRNRNDIPRIPLGVRDPAFSIRVRGGIAHIRFNTAKSDES